MMLQERTTTEEDLLGRPILRCALFDMDGTLFDAHFDFRALRCNLGLPSDGRPILEQLNTLPASLREEGVRTLLEAEAQGAAHGRWMPGAAALLSWLRAGRVRCGLITNNSRRSLNAVIERHPLPFDLTLTRDDGPMKPDPALFSHALRVLNATPDRAVAIGDAALDALAAHAAGIREICLVHLSEDADRHIPASIRYTRAESLDDVRRHIEARWAFAQGCA